MYFEKMKETMLKVDPNAEVYLFGSVAERKHNYVDILIVLDNNYIIEDHRSNSEGGSHKNLQSTCKKT